MEKLAFTASDTGEEIEVFILEQTTVTGQTYLLVTEEEEGDADCYILKEINVDDTEQVTYEFVEDDNELMAVGKVFSELLEDTEIEM